MERQYGAGPLLMRWIYNNVCGYPQTYNDLKKIKRLDGERSNQRFLLSGRVSESAGSGFTENQFH